MSSFWKKQRLKLLNNTLSSILLHIYLFIHHYKLSAWLSGLVRESANYRCSRVSGSIPSQVKFFFVINILYDCWLLKSIKKIIPLLRCENKATLYIQLLSRTVSLKVMIFVTISINPYSTDDWNRHENRQDRIRLKTKSVNPYSTQTIFVTISISDFHDWNRQNVFDYTIFRDWNRQPH